MTRLARRFGLAIGLASVLCVAGCNEILAINPPSDEILVPDAGQQRAAASGSSDLLDDDADGGQ